MEKQRKWPSEHHPLLLQLQNWFAGALKSELGSKKSKILKIIFCQKRQFKPTKAIENKGKTEDKKSCLLEKSERRDSSMGK